MGLDTDVPTGILSQVASYLSFKDLNSLIQTNKSLHSKLDLPKQKVNLHIHFETRAEQRMNFSVSLKPRNGVRDNECKRWVAKLCIKPKNPKERKSYTDQEKADLVAKFYYSRRKKEENDNCLERIFSLGYMEGLASHLQFVFSKLHIDKLKLGRVPLNSEQILQITEKMRENHVSVRSLSIYQNMNKNVMDLIEACNPKRLLISVSKIPEGFFMMPVARKLTGLIVGMLFDTIDIDIFSLGATELQIEAQTNIRIADAQKYVTQWIEKKREIQYFSFRKHMDDNVDDLAMLLSIIDENLATVNNIKDAREHRWDRKFSLQITRILDGATLSLKRDTIGLYFSLLKS